MSKRLRTFGPADLEGLQMSAKISKSAITEEDSDAEIFFGEFHLIGELEGDGITSDDIQRLMEAGFYSVDSIVNMSKNQLLAIDGICEHTADKILTEVQRLAPITGYLTASMYYKKRGNLIQITTGSTELDRLLRGGIETGTVTEIFGESGSGKTQFCHTLAVTCQLAINHGGGNGKCLFIDTEGTFRPERLIETAKRYTLANNEVLHNVLHSRAYNCDQQTELLVSSSHLLSKHRYSLIIVDGAMSLYRAEFQGLLYERQLHLAKFMRLLHSHADRFGVAIIITNQVTVQLDNESVINNPKVIPTGGNIMAHGSNTRLYLKKDKTGTRICKIHKSSWLPEEQAVFTIRNDGIRDV